MGSRVFFLRSEWQGTDRSTSCRCCEPISDPLLPMQTGASWGLKPLSKALITGRCHRSPVPSIGERRWRSLGRSKTPQRASQHGDGSVASSVCIIYRYIAILSVEASQTESEEQIPTHHGSGTMNSQVQALHSRVVHVRDSRSLVLHTVVLKSTICIYM